MLFIVFAFKSVILRPVKILHFCQKLSIISLNFRYIPKYPKYKLYHYILEIYLKVNDIIDSQTSEIFKIIKKLNFEIFFCRNHTRMRIKYENIRRLFQTFNDLHNISKFHYEIKVL